MQVTDLRLTRRANLRTLLGGSAAVTAASALTLTGRFAGVAAAQTVPAGPIPITFDGGALGSFAGLFDIDRFAVQGGRLVAIGTLTGTVFDALGNALEPLINQALTLPVLLGANQTTGTCEILDLVLGPLDLTLLGLRVQLNQIHLRITAQQGPGNLLGNLLCAIAGLLDGNGPLQGLAQLLNQLLRLLG